MKNIKNRFKNNNEIDTDIRSLYRHYPSIRNLMNLMKVKELSIESEIRGINCVEKLDFKKQYINHIKESFMMKTNGDRDISEIMKVVFGVFSGFIIANITKFTAYGNGIIGGLVTLSVIAISFLIIYYLICTLLSISLNDSIVEKKKIFITNYYCDMYIKLIDIRINQINTEENGSV